MPNAIFQVGTTPAMIDGIPANVASVLVLNSGHCDVIVDNRDDVSLDPQSGCRVGIGRLEEFPRGDCDGDDGFQLFAVAAGAGGQLTITIFTDEDECFD